MSFIVMSEQRIKPFLTNVSILDLLETPENQRCSGVFKEKKMWRANENVKGQWGQT